MATSLRQVFHDIAEAIRAKGIIGTFKPIDMPALVEQIPSAPAQTEASLFYQHSGLSSIDVQNVVYVDFSKAQTIAGCFLGCSNLTSISLPEGFGSTAVNIGGCFSGCTSLTSLTLPDGFGQNATTLNYKLAGCFFNCNALQSLHLPSGFGQNATNTANCFYNCTSLTNITGNPNFKVSIDLSYSENLTHDSIMVVINGLQTVTSTQRLRLGSTNLAKLTEADKKIATDKGWTLV